MAIIGAGPAGCTLARLLLNESGINVTIFEGEQDLAARAQGGTLDLHTETGQRALKEAGLYKQFLDVARFDGEAMAIVDKRKTVVMQLGGTSKKNSRGRPEIDRIQLRRMLIDSLPEGTIHWGKRLQRVDPKDLSLHFADGVENGFDLLVGADGAWSKVRPILSSVQPYFAGLGWAGMVVEKASERFPHIDKFVNRGSVFGFSDGKGLTLQQKADDSLILYAWSQRDEHWQQKCRYDPNDPVQVKKKVLQDFDDWDPIFKEAIQAADSQQITSRDLYLLPVGHRWEPRPRVTLIGDAAHLMSPFAGEGVNLAMEDALKLAHAITAAKKAGVTTQGFHNSIRSFEAEMFRRTAPVAKMSRLSMDDMFYTPGAPQEAIAPWVRRFISDGWLIRILMPLWLVKLLLRWIFWW